MPFALTELEATPLDIPAFSVEAEELASDERG